MMLKRAFDLVASALGLLLFSPLLALVTLAIWLEDRHSPFYIAPRMARGGGTFRMVKFRSMVPSADRIGGTSTAGDDRRITRVGRFVRAAKIDELLQLWNVLWGDMSLVGPRPQVPEGVRLYTAEERHLLDVRPGITDVASIVFADEGAILEGSADPDLLYDQVIRPWKSRLALLHIRHRGFLVDLRVILLTAVAIISRGTALRALQPLLAGWGADGLLLRMARREDPLVAYPPPGAKQVAAHSH